MKNSALDDEPPSKFEGKKEVSRKRIDLNQLILTVSNDKIKNTPLKRAKNLEKQVRLKFQDYVHDESYIKTNNNSLQEISSTAKSISFTSNLDINPNNIDSAFNYSRKRNTTEIAEKKASNFYEMTSSYSFMPYIKKENKKEDLFSQSREQEIKEPAYILHNFDEEPAKKE